MKRQKQQNPQNLDTAAHIAWHPAFVEAIQLELEAYRDILEFHAEFPLTSEPLRIDCVVIKKVKDAVLTKNIAAIFREVNLLEFKSPGDYVSIADFYKVYAYACLYASLHQISINSITISFVESCHPEKLLRHLKEERGYKLEKRSSGIYTVTGDILPIQFIDSRKLPLDDNLWLKGLSNRLDPLSVLKIGDEITKLDKTNKVKAYMDVITKANFQAIEEAMKMSAPAKSLEEVFERTGFTARVEAKAEARGEERKALAIAQNMVNLGYPAEAIVSATRLDEKKVKKLYDKKK